MRVVPRIYFLIIRPGIQVKVFRDFLMPGITSRRYKNVQRHYNEGN